MAKIPHTRGHGQVRGWAELVEGTRMRFFCPAGHSWSKAHGGVTVTCKACRRAQLKSEKEKRCQR